MLSDRGRVRPRNEDACFMAVERGLFVVSDGVGGQQGGATAARLVVSMAPTLLEQELGATGAAHPAAANASHETERHAAGEAVRRAVLRLNQEVRLRGIQHAGLHGLAATVVLALLRGATAYVAHLGDSRAYRLREGVLRRLTVDHTVANATRHLRAEGANHVAGTASLPTQDPPAHSQLARYVGMAGNGAPDVRAASLQAGDRLLLCTDGLTGMLPERLLAHVLRRQPEPEGACRLLVGAANEAGGRDNVSVIAIYVDAIPARPLS
jgi:protein phosphatase